jgi:putative FmdB family regulatory protein
MPLYDYACTACGRVREVRHGFDESFDAPCEACGAPMRRVFNPAPVLFKGSGFYVTDSRRGSASGSTEPAKESSSATPAAKTEPAKTEPAPASSDKPSNSAA